MGKQRVGLENHGDVAIFRRHVGHVTAADQQLTGSDGFQPCDHVERRRLAATGRPDQHDERTIRDFEIEARNHDMRAETLLDIDKGNIGHEWFFSRRFSP